MSNRIEQFTNVKLDGSQHEAQGPRIIFASHERAVNMRKAEALIAKEQQVRSDAIALLRCGLRPKVVRMVMGNEISIGECTYLFAIQTPLGMEQRHGRLKFNSTTERTDAKSRASPYRKLTLANSQFCIRAIGLIGQAVKMGATHGDAVASTWRIETGARGLEEYSSVDGICCEDLAVIWRNYISDQIHFLQCGLCRSDYIDTLDFSNKCPDCAAAAKRVLQRNVA